MNVNFGVIVINFCNFCWESFVCSKDKHECKRKLKKEVIERQVKVEVPQQY